MYHNVPKFSDRQVWADIADPDQTAPLKSSHQGLHCLQFPLLILEKLSCSIFRVITTNFQVSEILGLLRYITSMDRYAALLLLVNVNCIITSVDKCELHTRLVRKF